LKFGVWTVTEGSVDYDGKGFYHPQSAKGSFSHRFDNPGTFFFTSGDSGRSGKSLNGKVIVEDYEDRVWPVNVMVNGHKMSNYFEFGMGPTTAPATTSAAQTTALPTIAPTTSSGGGGKRRKRRNVEGSVSQESFESSSAVNIAPSSAAEEISPSASYETAPASAVPSTAAPAPVSSAPHPSGCTQPTGDSFGYTVCATQPVEFGNPL
jgi:hypothetical protein